MSLVFVIDPETGEIKESLYATASYRSPQGVTVKPKTHAEEMRLRQISEDAVRIRKLKEHLAKMDQEMAVLESEDRLEELEKARRNRQSIAAEIQAKENFAHAVYTIHRLQARAAELERITVSVSAGDQTIDADLNMDDYTDHAFSRLSDRLDKLSEAFQSSEPDHVRHTMQQLVEIEEALEALPAAALRAHLDLLLRQELAQGVIETLSASGWTVFIEAEGSASAATRVTAISAIGDRAAVIFACDGQIYLETPGFSEVARESLQQLVLGTLQANGAPNSTGTCLDSHPIGQIHGHNVAEDPAPQKVLERAL